jgi:serine/threonine-protein kinase
MAKQLSREQFIRNLSDSGLFSQEEIDAALRAPAGSGEVDGEAVAQRLIAAGKLTPFQATAVRERHFDELAIANYQVLDRLGTGGMGTVYKARHRRMKRVVAIKVLARDVGQSENFVQRFQREVETIARLSHPNIVMAHDADEDAAGPFLVMEFVNGCDLATLVTKQGPLSVANALNCILQAAHGLAYAHAQGIIHRDIKPANLLRDVAGIVKVTDLGIARLSSLASEKDALATSGLTQTGSILGTVDYMAPEQAIDSTRIDGRADIYSLGATLYFLLVGEPPYPSQSVMAALLKHRDAPIPSLTEARKDIPAALDTVFRRMMAKAPAERFPSMLEVIRALEKIEVNGKPGSLQSSPRSLSRMIRWSAGHPSKAKISTLSWRLRPQSRARRSTYRPPRCLQPTPRPCCWSSPHGPSRASFASSSRCKGSAESSRLPQESKLSRSCATTLPTRSSRPNTFRT